MPRPKEVEKLQLMMAAGDAPDLCFTYDAVLTANYANQGGLYDLTKLMASSGKQLSAYIGPDALDYGKFNGKQYAVPGKRQLLGISGTWIRKDWLDKLGLPVPKTRDEWLKAVRLFKEKDPGNVGANLAPIGGGGLDANLAYSFFKLGTERDRSNWVGPTSTRINRDMGVPGLKEGLKFANMLNDEGLFSKDWALWPKNGHAQPPGRDLQRLRRHLHEQLSYMWIYNLMPAIQKNAPECVWVPCDPFTNAEGKTPKYVYSPIASSTSCPRPRRTPISS